MNKEELFKFLDQTPVRDGDHFPEQRHAHVTGEDVQMAVLLFGGRADEAIVKFGLHIGSVVGFCEPCCDVLAGAIRAQGRPAVPD